MDQKEINKILTKNKRMIELIAHKSYYEKFKIYIDREDFVQEAYLLSAKLIKKYDKRKGTLSTFLYANLPKLLIRYGNNNLGLIHIPAHIYESVRKIKKYCEINNIDTDTITDDIIIQFTSDKSRSINIIKRLIVNGYICKSLNFDSVLELDNYIERYGDIDEKIDIEISKRKISHALSSEKKRDVKLINEYYNDGYILKDLAVKYNEPLGTIAERIRRTRKRLQSKLMKYKEDLLND